MYEQGNEWRRAALCAPRDGLPATAVHVAKWFPRHYYHGNRPTPEAEAALAVCAQCPVRVPCLEANLDEVEGIFGGTTPRDRGKVRSRRGRVA